MSRHCEVRSVQNETELKDVYRTRYSVYIEELGWSTCYANPEARTLTDDLDTSGNVFAAFQDSEVVGTMRTHFSGQCDLGKYVELYRLRDLLRVNPCSVAIATMFMVRRQWRFSRVAFELMTTALKQAVQSGIDKVFIDCTAELAPFYRKLGFTTHFDSFVHPEYGPGICMAMPVQQCRLLRRSQ